MRLAFQGTVRTLYLDGTDEVVIVTSDRVAVDGQVLPNSIPDKGRILTALTLWWSERLATICPHHVLSATDVPERWAGRALRCRYLDMIPIEIVVRAHLAGAGLAEYAATGALAGRPLPSGLTLGSRLPEPTVTFALKGPPGQCDTPVGFGALVDQAGHDTAYEIRRIAREVYDRGAQLLATRGLILADTKIELGMASDGTLVLGDEMLTPDSSRLWPTANWRPDATPYSLDRQFVRDWANGTGWRGDRPAPRMPDQIVAEARTRYVAAYERITGQQWPSSVSRRSPHAPTECT
jgi:phosphoribosylaminoimidazole-succinocarboxamide synthase